MTRRFAAVLSACLVGCTAQAAAQTAPPAEATTLHNIRFDGHCDGFEITVTGNYAAALPTGCAARQGAPLPSGKCRYDTG